MRSERRRLLAYAGLALSAIALLAPRPALADAFSLDALMAALASNAGGRALFVEKKTLASRFTSKFDETTLKAELGLSRFAPLAANFDIDIDRIDLDRYLPAGKAEASSPADPKVDLGGLRGIEARGKLHIGALQVKNITVTEFRSEIRIAGISYCPFGSLARRPARIDSSVVTATTFPCCSARTPWG